MTNETPKAYFKYILAMDSETTGVNFDSIDPSEGHQAVSWGFIVADSETLLPVEELYVEIKWNAASIASKQADPEFALIASTIHGITFNHLEENGISEKEAVTLIANLIVKYWGPTRKISTLGHNVRSFDIPFLDAMFKRHGIELAFNSRHCDSHSVGFVTLGSYSSDALFEGIGCEERTSHNALEDAHMSLTSCRRIRTLWNQLVGVKAYD